MSKYRRKRGSREFDESRDPAAETDRERRENKIAIFSRFLACTAPDLLTGSALKTHNVCFVKNEKSLHSVGTNEIRVQVCKNTVINRTTTHNTKPKKLLLLLLYSCLNLHIFKSLNLLLLIL